ncbi:hypothetical protein AB0J35_59340 [Nonomuraea angiospora]|uniref:hypothetical protein n=1 Tax=Nonomuraea angiospora TaxID=46172 RepID=UPI003448E841
MIPPLSAEDVPGEAKELRAELAGMLPFAPIDSLLIELSENVNFFGVITVDVEAELVKLDGGGWRPLRPPSLRPEV